MGCRGCLRLGAGLVVLLLLFLWLVYDSALQRPDPDAAVTADASLGLRTAGPPHPEQRTPHSDAAVTPPLPGNPVLAGTTAEADKRGTPFPDSPDGSLILVQGTVVDADDANPVAGAHLYARSARALERTATSDSEGAFPLEADRQILVLAGRELRIVPY